ISGSNSARGADILDLTDPEAPVKVGEWSENYFHDIYVRNDTLFGSAGSNPPALILLDVKNKRQPTLIAQIPFPDGGFVHNAWATEDGPYVMTTQETRGLPVKMWNITDPFNAEIVDQYLSSPSLLAHNTHLRGNYAYISHYGDGLRILDIADPSHLVEVGYYDTHPDDRGGFEGNWGAFPFTSSGYIYATDEDLGLFVISFNGRRAGRLRGRVIDSETDQPIAGVTLELLESGQKVVSDSNGDYKVGFPDPGDNTIAAYSFLYDTTTFTIETVEGESVEMDIGLRRRSLGSVAGSVLDRAGAGIDSVQIKLLETPFDLVRTGSDGRFGLGDLPAGTYLAAIARWGYRSIFREIEVVANQVTMPQIFLESGYADNFELDLGWKRAVDRGVATFGLWQMLEPAAIGLGPAFHPSQDVTPEPGTRAYFARTLGAELSLTSPAFDLTGSPSAVIRYYLYWLPRGNNADSLVVDISADDGAHWTTLAVFTEADLTESWQEESHDLPGSVERTAQMKIRFVTREKGQGSCFALIDDFEIMSSVTSVEEPDSQVPRLYALEQNYPNPFNPSTTIRYSLRENAQVRLTVYDLLGRQIRILVDDIQNRGEHQVVWDARDEQGKDVASGVYFYRIETAAFKKTVKMLFIQ
ncbi:MAG: choice-of-anchor B family protein, partial [bacterium]